jgi:SAM-dependent methyltransferase
MSTVENYTEYNRAAWNEAAKYHEQAAFAKLLADFRLPGHSVLDETEAALLAKIGVEGKAVAQLSCNNGRELLSIKNMGAGHCTGFDISDAFIEQGRRLADAGGIDVEFVRTDVYAISHDYDGRYDLIYITIGALGWLPDLPGFFDVIRRLLAPRGWLLIYEMHPILDMLEIDKENPLKLHHSYFRTEPYREEGGLDYLGNQEYQAPVSYWFHHKMSDVLQACIDRDLEILHFEEYPHDLSNNFQHLENEQARLPLSYALMSRLKLEG